MKKLVKGAVISLALFAGRKALTKLLNKKQNSPA